jgi:SsrA-binding protein
MSVNVVATNRKARHNYFLLDTYEAGIVLKGSEIKSIRGGQISLAQAYVTTDGREAWLMNAHIAPYNEASRFNKLSENVRQKGATIVPLRVYLKDGLAKIEIALAKGKKRYDKRAEIAKRDAQRELDRRYKQRG